MSDTNRTRISYIKEVTYGTTPTGALQEVRQTGESLRADTAFSESAEIRDDRQVADVVRTNRSASGSTNFELTYGSYDDLLASALLGNAWSSTVTVGPGITFSLESIATSATTYAKLLDSANGLAGLLAGQWIKIDGFDTNATFYAKVFSSAAGELEIVVMNDSNDVTDEAAGDTVTITMGAQIVNGTTLDSYSIERRYDDLSNIFAAFRGMSINQLSVNTVSEAIVTGSFDWLGKEETDETATIGTSYTAENTNDVISAVDHIGNVMENNTDIELRQVSWTLNNNLRARTVIGSLGPVSLGTGTIQVTGSIIAYFETAALYARYLAFSDTNLAYKVVDADGNIYFTDFPHITLTSGQRVAEGKDGDVMANIGFQAYMDPSEAITIRIARFAAA